MNPRWTAWTLAAALPLALLLAAGPPPAPARAAAPFDQYDPGVPGLRAEMLTADFWIAALPRPDEVILSPREIESFNRRNMAHCEKLVDIARHPRTMTGEAVRAAIAAVSRPPEKPLFHRGAPLSPARFERMAGNCALERVPAKVRVRFGVTVRRTEMRAFPSPQRVFAEADDYEFDRFIETTLYPLEPLAILHESRDGAWCFAQSGNYRAWIASADVALGDPGEIFPVLARDRFLVVTGKAVFTGVDPLEPDLSEIRLDMGVRLPLARRDEIPGLISGRHPMGNHVVKFPARDRRGRLAWKLALIALGDDVHAGYLPYTRATILRQAFKFLGERYGWGGMFHARDCSAFLLDAYRTVGLLLPRNSGEQGRLSLGPFHEFPKEMPLDARVAAMAAVPPVTPVYMDGHAMLYLNRSGNDLFILHDFIQMRTGTGRRVKTVRTRAVFVTPLLRTYLSSGKTYLEGLYGAREFR